MIGNKCSRCLFETWREGATSGLPAGNIELSTCSAAANPAGDSWPRSLSRSPCRLKASTTANLLVAQAGRPRARQLAIARLQPPSLAQNSSRNNKLSFHSQLGGLSREQDILLAAVAST